MIENNKNKKHPLIESVLIGIGAGIVAKKIGDAIKQSANQNNSPVEPGLLQRIFNPRGVAELQRMQGFVDSMLNEGMPREAMITAFMIDFEDSLKRPMSQEEKDYVIRVIDGEFERLKTPKVGNQK